VHHFFPFSSPTRTRLVDLNAQGAATDQHSSVCEEAESAVAAFAANGVKVLSSLMEMRYAQ
jgi:hypothetical protein